MSRLEQAIQLAVTAHAGQMDEDGMPHIVHCFEVFHGVQLILDEMELDTRLGEEGRKLSQYTREEIEIAAFLHDVVEDTFITLSLVEAQFGVKVREIVDSVTRRGLGKGETKEFYRDFIYRAKENEGGNLVKIADLTHNFGRSSKIKKASWRDKLEFKYSIALRVLNGEDRPTWEQASYSVTYDDPSQPPSAKLPTAHYFIADPNGKKIEVSEEEFKTLTGK